MKAATTAEATRVRMAIVFPLLWNGNRTAAFGEENGAMQQIVQVRRSAQLLHENQQTCGT
jgi:hypothetical protein